MVAVLGSISGLDSLLSNSATSPAGPLDTSRSNSSYVGHLEASLALSTGTGFDVSIAGDIRIDDSLELEKCDHVVLAKIFVCGVLNLHFPQVSPSILQVDLLVDVQKKRLPRPRTESLLAIKLA